MAFVAGSIGHEFHEFHENDHCHLDVIGLKYNFLQSLRPRFTESSGFSVNLRVLRVSVVNKVLEFFLSLACPYPSGDPKSPFHSSEAKVLSPRAASYTMKTSMPCSPKNIVAATAALKVADAFCRGTDG